MQAFPGVGAKEGLVSCLVVPGLKCGTGFQSGKDMNHPRLGTSLAEDLLNAVFFTEILFANVFDGQAIFPGYPLRIFSNGIGDRLEDIGKIKHLVSVQGEIFGDPLRVANRHQRADYNDPVKTMKYAGDQRLKFGRNTEFGHGCPTNEKYWNAANDIQK